jgi:hypothetical protein
MEAQAGSLPAALDRLRGDLQKSAGFGVRQSLVPDQVKHFALLVRECPDLLVEQAVSRLGSWLLSVGSRVS